MVTDSDRAREVFEEHTPLERARDALAGAVRPTRRASWPEDDGAGYARAAQIAVVAQAEAAHRQADALERIAYLLAPDDQEPPDRAVLRIFEPTGRPDDPNRDQWLVVDGASGQCIYVDAGADREYLTPVIAQRRRMRVTWEEV